MTGKIKKIVLFFLALCMILLLAAFAFYFWVKTPLPCDPIILKKAKIEQINGYTYSDKSWIHTNKSFSEIYLEGNPLERGIAMGSLCDSLQQQQEIAFVNEIKQHVPSAFNRFFIHKLIAWFNRNMHEEIPQEYLMEIYGSSLFASDAFDREIGPKYSRILNYHAAHDIGHGLKEMNLVGCSGFAVWDTNAQHATLFTGRNFDFYAGDDFNKSRCLYFINPSEGYPFVSLSWAGMSGVVSGMNLEGLTITLNAAPSAIPSSSAEPVSLLAREIVQYARTIHEAFEIAKKRNTFVSELFMISSAIDGKAAIIEKTPESTQLYFSEDNQLICTNHFQSDSLSLTERNKNFTKTSSTLSRYNRLETLLKNKAHTSFDLIPVLYDRTLENNKVDAPGNESAINQLNAHHGVFFNPIEKIIWVNFGDHLSSNFIAYDLKAVFKDKHLKNAIIDSLTITTDSFYSSQDYANYLTYRALKKNITKQLTHHQSIQKNDVAALINANPELYEAYEIAGDAYQAIQESQLAKAAYSTALEKQLSGLGDKLRIEGKLQLIKE